MKRFTLPLLAIFAAALFPSRAEAQGSINRNYVTVQLSPDRDSWEYEPGQTVTFTVSVLRENVPLKNVEVSYQWGEEMLPALETGSLSTGNGTATLKVKGMKKPGFMTCRADVTVDGRKYGNYITVGFAPGKIETTTALPADFREFWDKTIADARRTPLEPLLTLVPEKCTPTVDYYHVRFQNNRPGIYIYGILCVPKEREGKKFPALMNPPGAGVKYLQGDTSYAQQGVVTLQIGIHGIPLDQDEQIYRNLNNNGLGYYWAYRNDDRDTYYYKNVYTGCVRAMDFLASLPYVDDQRLGVFGGSQGGALTIVTAGLDPRVKFLTANYPALCQIGGYHKGSVGGWPGIFRNPEENDIERKVAVSEYYDVVNFARFVQAEGYYCLGYNDRTCPPTTTYAAYNVVTAPKLLLTPRDSAHWLYPEHRDVLKTWLIEQLKRQ